MIRLILVLLFVTIKLTMRCEENESTTKDKLRYVLYEGDSVFIRTSRFKWQTCEKSVPESKYLPIRAGTSIGSKKFEVIALNHIGGITRGNTLKDKFLKL